MRRTPAVIAAALFWFLPVRAQDLDRIWEAGFQLTTIDFQAVGEKPLGLGGRVGRNFGSHLALEAEANYFPQNPSGNFGQTHFAAGVKTGARMGPLGAFLKVRPGLIHFGGPFFTVRNPGVGNRFALEVGGVGELNVSPRWGLRMDLGDIMVFYGNARIDNALATLRPGTSHNLQAGFGFFVRL